jgi:hypothetical protein
MTFADDKRLRNLDFLEESLAFELAIKLNFVFLLVIFSVY